MRGWLAAGVVLVVGVVVPATAAHSGARVALAFDSTCSAPSAPTARRVLGARATIAVPRSWHVVRAQSSPPCAAPYLLIDPPADRDSCVQVTVSATASTGRRLVLGGAAIAGGPLPARAGMRGSWHEVELGVTPAYPAYVVDGVYRRRGGDVLYVLAVSPPPSYPNGCRGEGPRARAIARQLATSFQVRVTDPAAAESFG